MARFKNQIDRLMHMKADGSGARELAKINNWYAPPSFSPDGKWVTFESGEKRNEQRVWVVSTTAGEARPIVDEPGSFPVWRPQ